MAKNTQAYNFAAIRKLLLAAFTPEELRRFCQDRPVFCPILDEFGPGHGFNDMVDRVITYCRKNLLFDELLSEVRKAKLRQYARFERHLYTPAQPSPAPSARRVSSRKLLMGVFAVLLIGAVILCASLFLDQCSTFLESLSSKETQYTREPDQEIKDTPGPEPVLSPESMATGAIASMEASQTITISRASTGSSFGGALTITVTDASRYGNRVSAVVSAPGFAEKKIEAQYVGYRFIYEAKETYEIQIMGATDGGFINEATATFRITVLADTSSTANLTPTARPDTLSAPPQSRETAEINRAAAVDFFDGALTIAVIDASRYSNEVSALISASGFPEVTIDTQPVGYRTFYQAEEKYDIQIVGASDGGIGGNSSATFAVVNLDHFTPAITLAPVEASETVTITRASAEGFFQEMLTIAVLDASHYENEVSAVVASPGFLELWIEKKPVGYKTVYEANQKYEIQILGATDGGIGSNSAARFRVTVVGAGRSLLPVAQDVTWGPVVGREPGICTNGCEEFIPWQVLKEEIERELLPQVGQVPAGSVARVRDWQGRKDWVVQISAPNGNTIGHIWFGTDPLSDWALDGLVRVGYPSDTAEVWDTLQRYSDGSYQRP